MVHRLRVVKLNAAVFSVVAPFKRGLLKVFNRYIQLSRDNVDVSFNMK
jgi:hypothetical protein